MIEHFSTVSFTTVAVGGLAAVFLPCNFPMLLGYIALLIGDDRGKSLAHVLKKTFWFFIGFALTYAAFGSIAGLFGQFSATTRLFNEFRPLLMLGGGLLFIIVGLVLLRVIPLPSRLRKARSIPLPKSLSIHSGPGSAVVGMIFAAGWSPCIGPVLGGILVLAASSGSALTGALLLILFSFSMMLPFTVLAILYSRATRHLKFLEKAIPVMRVIAGVLFLILGLSFVLNDFTLLGMG